MKKRVTKLGLALRNIYYFPNYYCETCRLVIWILSVYKTTSYIKVEEPVTTFCIQTRKL